jgi:hypothetical protein
MDEEIRVLPGESLEKLAGADLVPCKALELPHRPRQERLIDVSQQGSQPRRGVSPVVFDPIPEERIKSVGNIP